MHGHAVFAHPAWGIVVDSRKQIYFSDLETVYKIDSLGKLTVFRAGVSGRHVHDISIGAEDNIYGLDNSYNPQTEKYPRSIWKVSPNGEFSYIVPMTDNLPIGRSIWQDLRGNTYSVEPYNNEKKQTKIIRREPSGATSVFAGGKYGYLDGRKDKAQFGVITNMCFGKDGAIYLSGEDKVRKIDKLGIVTTIYSNKILAKIKESSETSSQFFGLDVDEKNNVFAADFGRSLIIKISADGEVSTVFNSEKDWTPLGVAASADEIFVLEGRPVSSHQQSGNRVLKITSDGKSTIVAALEQNKSSLNTNSHTQPVIKAKFGAGNNSQLSKVEFQNLAFFALAVITLFGFIALVFLRKYKQT